VLISSDGGKSWTEHGNIRLTPNDRYFGWAENNLVELSDGRIIMIIRADSLGGMLYQAVSRDGGKTWPDYAGITQIPNPEAKQPSTASAEIRSQFCTIPTASIVVPCRFGSVSTA